MQEIEKFTRQTIEVEKVEGFGPGPDERAEPIAMGRQTLWGGLGKPPSRDVMAAAARAARQEMMERIREKKPAGGGRGGEGRGQAQGQRAERPPRSPNPGQPSHGAGPAHNGAPRSQGPRRDRPERGPRIPAPAGMPRDDFEHQPPSHHQEDDFQPRANAHLGTQSGVNAFGHKSGGGAGRQPDPTMTSVDLLSRNNRGGGGGGGKRRTGGGGGGGRPGGGGGGYAGKKSGGGFGR